ncbi:ABC transporter permease [Undibacterium parvum]|nr:ABC transporter permease [Undibacterium parvum]
MGVNIGEVIKFTCLKIYRYNALFFYDLLMPSYSLTIALSDITAAVRRYPLVGMLGWQDVRQRYRRSALGPFWLTISMAIMIGTMGVVFGQIFKAPLTEFLPFLAAGTILWSFISAIVSEGCTGFIAAEGIVKQLPIPLFVHILRMIWRNVLILGHNIVIFPLVLLAVGKPVGLVALISIPGFILLLINLTWVALILSVICARYRDLPQIIGSVIQVVFYLTPIMWMPHLLPDRAGLYLLDLNPVFHLLEIVRSPLLGQFPTWTNWVVSLALALFGWVIALTIYGHYKRRIAYWL